jgi:TAG lipase/steryl ester hydrolase/phospholipase A2/LPA acyltransferase
MHEMYTFCRVGTKKLTEDYIQEVIKQFHIICETNFPELSKEAKYEFMANTQRSFGRTALLLSGGAIFGRISMDGLIS